MEKYLCIHGHFYQPPRENPWLEAIELQDRAHPYHDWNERITAECYATNATSRILDEKGRIVQMANNYAKISFNFGPTLLAWLEDKAPDVYGAILEADRQSRERYSGHGSAMAQAYNHMILPLACIRDKYTQILWGLRDFQHRFGRDPEGMWLPETAVDLETLDIIADLGIRFTILAPLQAHRLRLIEDEKWQDASGEKIDPTIPYTLRLPSGRDIAIFFYDGPISRAVAFERLLRSGEAFAQRLLGGFSEKRTWPQLVSIATDGETYGHHHRFGDMALAYALDYIESNGLAQLTNYGEHLERYQPKHEVEIQENTSWSCIHGVERWRGDCGCNSGGHPEWNQGWRGPLRKALDWLRDGLAPAYEKKAGVFLRDPWTARNEYIGVLLDRSDAGMDRFFQQQSARSLDEDEKIAAVKLLELQRHAMLMYTSCGWFFDELSGIETVQVIQYAGRALQLSKELFGDALEHRFMELIERAESNIAEFANGRRIYERFVEPSMLDLEKVGAHYAINSLFQDSTDHTFIYCYDAEREDYRISEVGAAKLAAGRVRLTSQITGEWAKLCFGVLHWGDHNLNCGIHPYQEEAYRAFLDEAFEAFDRADFPIIILILDKHFGHSTYSLRSLFRDEQSGVIEQILDSTLQNAESAYRQLYESHAPMMRFLKDLDIPAPKGLYTAAELVLNASLRRAIASEELYPQLIEPFLEEAQMEGVTLDAETLEFELRRTLERMADRLSSDPGEFDPLTKLESAVKLLGVFPFEVNLWKIQNTCYDLLRTFYPEVREKADRGDEKALQWVKCFRSLCGNLSVYIA